MQYRRSVGPGDKREEVWEAKAPADDSPETIVAMRFTRVGTDTEPVGLHIAKDNVAII